MRPWQAALKRLTDLVLGTVAVIVLLPVGLVIALAVVVDSAGPPIYGAVRIGRNGRPFTMLKFRSMARGADAVGPGVTGAYDFRVTRVGAFLRRAKLDELPQLLNVLAGQMSLVGPRPEAPRFVERWTPEERGVLRMRPGITGPTQVAYINEEELLSAADPDEAYETELMHAKLAIDLEYVRDYRFRRDVALLWRTVAGIFSAAERRSNQPRRRYTIGERLRSAHLGPIVLDAALAAVAAGLAVGLRIDRNNIFVAIATYWVFLPLAAVIRPAGFLIAGAYLRMWRYPTVSDIALILSSLAAGTVVMTLAIFFVLEPSSFPGTAGFPRSALIIELILSSMVLGGIRIATRIRQEDLDVPASQLAGPPRPIAIYGAGEAGAMLAREMLRNKSLRLEPAVFLDDDPKKHGRQIYGIEVVGGVEDLPQVVRDREISEVIIAMPRASGAELRPIVAVCEAIGASVRTLPAVQELLDSTVAISKVRQVRVDDLLRRDAASIPEAPIREFLGGRTVLVTGAGGSIGSEVARQAAALGARSIIMLDRAETALFWIDDEIRRRNPGLELRTQLGDVTDERLVNRLLDELRPDIIVHAAAHKHVPLSEVNVAATVLSNVRGTRVMAQAASRAGTPTFIFVSTDKAVDPSSVMGATKRLGERLIREIGSESGGRFVTVRFGNVLGSQGSVIELWSRQIIQGGPITITHPEMTRYFMTIPEAVRLILLAGATGTSGEVHVLRMGEPIRITELAHDLIRLTAPPGAQVDISYTGLRAGERLQELLFTDRERQEETAVDAIVVAHDGDSAAGTVKRACQLEELAEVGDEEELRRELLG